MDDIKTCRICGATNKEKEFCKDRTRRYKECCGNMEKELKKLGVKNADANGIWRCISGLTDTHLGFHFENYPIEEYGDISFLNRMTLIDLIEMICDWMAATKRHNSGNIYKSLAINQKRFGIDQQIINILENTIDFVEEIK